MNENKEAGFIPVWRSLFDHWIWQNNDPFDKRSAWVDLIRSAEIGDKTTMQDGKLIHLKRGEIKASIRYLQTRWKWGSTSKVERFLNILENDGMISTEKRQGITVITICKYYVYNDFEKSENTPTRTPIGTETGQQKDRDGTAKRQRRDEVNNITSKQINNITNGISSFGEPNDTTPNQNDFEKIFETGYLDLKKNILNSGNVSNMEKQLIRSEYQKLVSDYSQQEIIDCIVMMENSKSIKNKTSVYLTLLNFLKSQFGNSEINNHYSKFEEKYKEFIFKKIDAQPRIDKYEKRSLQNIIEYLKENSYNKSYDGALKSWEYILDKWSVLDQFMQNRIKLTEIDKDILKIITAIKNGINRNATVAKNNSTSERKDF